MSRLKTRRYAAHNLWLGNYNSIRPCDRTQLSHGTIYYSFMTFFFVQFRFVANRQLLLVSMRHKSRKQPVISAEQRRRTCKNVQKAQVSHVNVFTRTIFKTKCQTLATAVYTVTHPSSRAEGCDGGSLLMGPSAHRRGVIVDCGVVTRRTF